MTEGTRLEPVAVEAARAYSVHIGEGVLDRLPAELPPGCPAVALVADEQVASLYAPRAEAVLASRVRTERFTFPSGEASKARATKERIEDAMLARGLGRDAALVALGGGVTLDLAGFVASTYQRGIPWIAAPTSLLAMVDASVGGKTGVNTPAGKNMVGTFFQPRAVLADLGCLSTLPRAELDNGLAEMVKHAVIADAAYLGDLIAAAEALRGLDPEAFARPVRRSVEIKAEVVSADPEERDLRQILNYGHTIAHAIESLSGYGTSHGRAVAAGVSVEAGIASSLGLLDPGERDRVRRALAQLELPLAPPPGMGHREILDATRMDKKGRRGRPRYALPEAIGRMARGPEGYGHEVEDAMVLAALEESRQASPAEAGA